MPTHIKVKLMKSKEKILNTARNKRNVHTDRKIRITTDILLEINNELLTQNSILSENIFNNEGKVESFSYKLKLK